MPTTNWDDHDLAIPATDNDDPASLVKSVDGALIDLGAENRGDGGDASVIKFDYDHGG
jgi:hypothetical protein